MVRRAVLAVVLAGLLPLLAFASPFPADLLGAWYNVDLESGGLGQVTITPNDVGGLQVWGYGVCDPSYCEWGAADLYFLDYPGAMDADVAIAIWQLAGQTIVLRMEFAGELMVAEMFYLHKDESFSGMTEIATLRHAI